MAYDPGTRDTYVAWVDSSDTSIDLCTVTAAAPSCNGGAGPDQLVDPLASSGGAGALYSDQQLAVEPSGEVVVLAEVDGASSSAYPPGYARAGVVAWSSPAGGAGFAAAGQGLANGGVLLASSAGDMPSGGAVALDGSDIGVYGDSYPFGSGFTDFGLGASAPSTTPVVDSTGDYGSRFGITGNQLASVPDPAAPGEYIVVAVSASSSAPPGCPASSSGATGYGIGVGTPAALQGQAAWSSGYLAPISCQAASPVLAGGGPTGGSIGLLEDEGPGLSGSGSDGVYYRPFDLATDSFGGPVLVSSETGQTLSGAEELTLAQDPAGGVYASWFDARGVLLSYSSNAGGAWQPPLAVPLPISPDDDVVVAAVGGGSAEFAYSADSSGSAHEFLAPVSYSALAAG